MKKFYSTAFALFMSTSCMLAQGWPANYSGVMLQGFYWDSYTDSKWTKLEKLADDLSQYFSLVWVPQSGKCLESYNTMGYTPYYYFNQNSSFGTEAQLRSMIQTFKEKNIGTIADVVINHHNTDGWFNMPAETYNGVTYQLKSTDIVGDDDDGATLTQANSSGVSLSTNNDEGEGWLGMRDLDHQSSNVQTIVKAYEKYLKDDLGYIGFRYDMVKGFDASHIADYNDASGIEYSVGEYWDNNTKIENWIDATNKKSAAFDFQFRYNVRDAINKSDWSQLKSDNNLVHDENYRQYSVTFVENHDTQYRDANNPLDPIKKDTLAANAYLLAMPGTPCVFYKHYLAYPNEIKAMIDARKAAGITNTSSYSNFRSTTGYFANKVSGSKANLIVYVGSGFTAPSTSLYKQILSGPNYAYYMSLSAEIPFIDQPSGSYDTDIKTTLTAVSEDANAKLVYTLDGTEPTASSTTVNSGETITIAYAQGTSTTLKVALLKEGTVSSSITRTYTFPTPKQIEFETPATGYTYTAYFVAPVTWGESVDVYAWVWDSNNNYTGGNWPGDNEHVYCIGQNDNGQYIWQWCYYGELTSTPSNIIFNNGSGGTNNQTNDKIFTNGGWYQMSSTTSDEPTLGVDDIESQISSTINKGTRYNLSGQHVTEGYKGIVIQNGKKFIVK